MKQLRCVMLIDDHHPTNILHTIAIETADCVDEIITFVNPEKALNYLENLNSEEKIRPNLIFLDINMPGMNGWEFLEKYNQLSKEKKSESILMMLTTSTHPDDLKKAEENEDVFDYIIKPLTHQIFLELVDKYF